jgi:mono/diheme cytochrome c family protein
MRSGLITVATVLVFVLPALVFTWSGVYDVAASAPHAGFTLRLLTTARDPTIAYHSREIDVPGLSANEASLSDVGFHHYHAMCRLCHGAPGYSHLEFTQGINPQPPDLATAGVQEQIAAELYWIVRNGIRMNGMPSFSVTHDEDGLLRILFL